MLGSLTLLNINNIDEWQEKLQKEQIIADNLIKLVLSHEAFHFQWIKDFWKKKKGVFYLFN